MAVRVTKPSRGTLLEAAPIVLVVLAAIGVYTRFSPRLQLTRDEGIYTYSAIRLAHGTAPYRSIWDPKTPGTSMLGALAIRLGDLFGIHDVAAIRAMFFGIAVLTALALYLLCRVLWHSIPAALVGTGVFLCFVSWAFEAATGPDAKMPGVLLSLASMALAVRRRWLLTGLASGLAFVFWQPLLIYVVTAVVAALLMADSRRLRAAGSVVLGAAVPVGAICVYFAANSSFRIFLDAAFVQPEQDAHRSPGVGTSLGNIKHILTRYEQFNRWTFCIGLAAVGLLIVARLVACRRAPMDWVRDPLVCVVGLSLLAMGAFCVEAFLNYPWLDPLLPYAGIGFAGLYVLIRDLVAWVSTGGLARVGVPVVCGVATVVLLGASVAKFPDSPEHHVRPSLHVQRAQACALDEVAGPGRLWVFGDTVTLSLSGRTNPDNFIYFGGKVLEWKLSHLPGGVRGWERQILAAHPAVLEINAWEGPVRQRIGRFLKRHYHASWIGPMRVFLNTAARNRGERDGALSPTKQRLERPSASRLSAVLGHRCG